MHESDKMNIPTRILWKIWYVISLPFQIHEKRNKTKQAERITDPLMPQALRYYNPPSKKTSK